MISEDKIVDLESYIKKLDLHALNLANYFATSSQETLPTGKNLYDRLENLFYLEHEVKHLFSNQPSFFRYTEVDEILRKLQRTRIAEDKWWKYLLEIFLFFENFAYFTSSEKVDGQEKVKEYQPRS